MENLLRSEITTDWIAWYFIGLLAVFAWLRSREFGGFLSNGFGSLFLFEPTQKLQNKTLSSIESILLLVLNQVHIGLIVKTGFDLSNSQFWFIAFLLNVLLGIKILCFHYLGFISKQDYIVRYSLFQYLYFNIMMFFIVLALYFAIYFLKIEQNNSVYLLILLGGLHLFVQFRIGFQIFVKLHIRIFYIFLYFCALEFTPIVWGYYFLK